MLKSVIKTLSLTVFLLLSQVGQAQAETELHGRWGVRGLWQTGNLSQFSLNPDAQIILKDSLFEFEMNAAYTFFNLAGRTTMNDLWTHGLYRHDPQEGLFPVVFGLYGFSQSYKITSSGVLGAGGAYRFYDKSPHDHLEFTLYFGGQHFAFEETEARTEWGLGALLRYALPITPDLHLSVDFKSYHSAQDIQFWGVSNLARLHYQIMDNLSLNLSHQTIYNNLAHPSIQNLNTQMMFGVSHHI